VEAVPIAVVGANVVEAPGVRAEVGTAPALDKAMPWNLSLLKMRTSHQKPKTPGNCTQEQTEADIEVLKEGLNQELHSPWQNESLPLSLQAKARKSHSRHTNRTSLSKATVAIEGIYHKNTHAD
jgi:hypothetical protein